LARGFYIRCARVGRTVKGLTPDTPQPEGPQATLQPPAEADDAWRAVRVRQGANQDGVALGVCSVAGSRCDDATGPIT
jgi:hypothetical protein